ncbi:ABC transporter [Halovulum dunhuangense]|uniref:ABC transporter n=1 Tax=Halovulum dunhuangense TaxID=1505036 RepID=A0A849L3Q6_9RHOB|nr:ABC-type transport auxiliary lipoprotein family protein [Halovulum dunhuangense]NNU80883.1 ABC transporter [Halovulum dunhuangense]
MPLPLPLRAATIGTAMLALGGCTALDSFTASTRPLDTYELTPATTDAPGRGLGPNVYVEEPAGSGAIATDRIAVKPDALQVRYLPDGRWADPATEHVQLLLVRSLAATGRFGVVTGQTGGPIPDWVLVSDLQDFHARLGPEGEGASATVTLRLSAIRDADRQAVASRVFTRTATAASTATNDLVASFDAALGAVLSDAAAWAVTTMR